MSTDAIPQGHPMKALTIRQPWASLIALGVKHIETRSWRAPQSLIGQTIAIHAGKRRPEGLCGDSVDLGDNGRPVGDWLPCTDGSPRKYERLWIEHYGVGATGRLPGDDGYAPLPLGAVVATATLADCLPMVDEYTEWHAITLSDEGVYRTWKDDDGSPMRPHRHGCENVTDQLPYGDFQPGRWAWMLTNVQPCAPVPAKGKQGLWKWQP